MDVGIEEPVARTGGGLEPAVGTGDGSYERRWEAVDNDSESVSGQYI